MVDGPDTIASEPAMRYVGWLDGDASSDTHCSAERRIEACEQGLSSGWARTSLRVRAGRWVAEQNSMWLREGTHNEGALPLSYAAKLQTA